PDAAIVNEGGALLVTHGLGHLLAQGPLVGGRVVDLHVGIRDVAVGVGELSANDVDQIIDDLHGGMVDRDGQKGGRVPIGSRRIGLKRGQVHHVVLGKGVDSGRIAAAEEVELVVN